MFNLKLLETTFLYNSVCFGPGCLLLFIPFLPHSSLSFPFFVQNILLFNEKKRVGGSPADSVKKYSQGIDS